MFLRHNIRGYAFNAILPRYAIAPPVLILCQVVAKPPR